MRLVAVLGLCAMALLPGSASAARHTLDWVFRTPGEVAYCAFENQKHVQLAFRCVTPSDGFWIRLSSDQQGARVTKGYARELRGFHRTRVYELDFGREWLSSDAAVISAGAAAQD